MRILGIDPGTRKSALVVLSDHQILYKSIEHNEGIVESIVNRGLKNKADVLVVEGIQSFGMAVGQETFTTVEWIGRFIQAWTTACANPREKSWCKVYRQDIKLHFCNSVRAKDSNIRQVLIDRFIGTEGGKAVIGTKKNPGPLYGISKDLWSALAIALYFHESRLETWVA